MKFLDGYEHKQWKYISNQLSLVRIPLAFLFVYFVLEYNLTAATIFNFVAAVITATLAISSDGADGWFARKRNQITNLGKLLDPVADKIAIAITVVGFTMLDFMPLWFAIVIIGRDLLIISGVIYMIIKHPDTFEIPMSNWFGKIAVCVITVGLLLQLTGIGIWMIFGWVVVIFAVVFSIILYAKRFLVHV